MTEKIEMFNKLIKKSFLGREKRWNDFREFHKQIVDLASPELSEALGNIGGVCKKNPSWRVVFNARDYAWWGTYNHKKCDIIPIEELEKKVTKKLRDILDNMDSNIISMEEAEEIIKIFNK